MEQKTSLEIRGSDIDLAIEALYATGFNQQLEDILRNTSDLHQQILHETGGQGYCVMRFYDDQAQLARADIGMSLRHILLTPDILASEQRVARVQGLLVLLDAVAI